MGVVSDGACRDSPGWLVSPSESSPPAARRAITFLVFPGSGGETGTTRTLNNTVSPSLVCGMRGRDGQGRRGEKERGGDRRERRVREDAASNRRGLTGIGGSAGRRATGRGQGSRSPHSRGVLSVEALLVGVHGEGHLDLFVGIQQLQLVAALRNKTATVNCGCGSGLINRVNYLNNQAISMNKRDSISRKS